jgi:hypothetical protein
MPRGRGGARSGTPGTAYGNRTDLNAKMPIQTATNQAYGVASQQRAAQQAIPVAAQPVQGAVPDKGPQVAAAAAPAPTPEQVPMFAQQSPMSGIMPGDLKFMDPTDYPDEPVTAGSPYGPGPGPEALGAPLRSTLAETLLNAASQPGADPYLLDVAHAAQILGY